MSSTNSKTSTGRAKGPADPVTAYARDVVKGKIVAGKLVRLACERHLRDLKEGPKRGLRWDLQKALRAIAFFPATLRHYKGEWARNRQPFYLEPFQKFIVGSMFGWVVAKTGHRRFRTFYGEEPRKNGKTAMAAGMGLIMFVFDHEPGAEVYVAATKRDQAKLVYNDAAHFVRRSPALQRRIDGPYRNIMLAPASASQFVPLSAEDKTMDGLNPSCAILDEVHRHPDRGIVDVMRTGMGSRAQPMMIEITTAGDNIESICREHHDYSVNLLNQLFPDDSWFAFIACADEGDDWTDERVWYKANPNLGVSKHLEYMRKEFVSAKNKPAEQREFKRLHLGIWPQTVGGWMPMDRWDRCKVEIDDDLLKGRLCVAGVDLSATTDITAYSEFYLPTPEDPRWILRPWFWLPEAKVEAARRGEFGDAVRYDMWLDQGLIFQTPGDVVDYDHVHAFVTQRHAASRWLDLGCDPWNATQFMTQLMAQGYPVVEVRQGYKTLNEPTKKILELVLSGKLAHDGHPVMRWMMSNVSIERDPADSHKPSKKLSRQRIDGPVSAIIALSRGLARVATAKRAGPLFGGVDVEGLMVDMQS